MTDPYVLLDEGDEVCCRPELPGIRAARVS